MSYKIGEYIQIYTKYSQFMSTDEAFTGKENCTKTPPCDVHKKSSFKNKLNKNVTSVHLKTNE